MKLVVSVMEYRMAKEGQRMMNDTQAGMQQMAKSPELVRFWKMLTKLAGEENGD